MKVVTDACLYDPVEVRQSNQGKLVAATQVQSAEYLKPLFKQLRQRVSVQTVLTKRLYAEDALGSLYCPTSSLGWQRLSTSRRSESTETQTIPTCNYRLEMHHGRSGSQW